MISSGGSYDDSAAGDQDGGRHRRQRLTDLADRVLATSPRLGPVRLVCIDGPACAGKTTLAHRLAGALGGCPLIHMDDLYEGWDGLPSVGARLRTWVLDPIGAGRPGRFRRYDWAAGAYAEWHEVPLAPALVVEGVGAAARVVDAVSVLRMWVEAPEATRFARGLSRDGGAFGPHWSRWADAERRHFAVERTRARAHLILDGAPSAAYDPANEIVVTDSRDASIP